MTKFKLASHRINATDVIPHRVAIADPDNAGSLHDAIDDVLTGLHDQHDIPLDDDSHAVQISVYHSWDLYLGQRPFIEINPERGAPVELAAALLNSPLLSGSGAVACITYFESFYSPIVTMSFVESY